MLERVVQRDSLILFWPMHTNEHTLRYILILEYLENCTYSSTQKLQIAIPYIHVNKYVESSFQIFNNMHVHEHLHK